MRTWCGFNNTFFENAAHHVQNDFNNAVEPLLDKPEASDSIRDSLYSRGVRRKNNPTMRAKRKKLNSQIKDAYADVYQQVSTG